jgi:autoinducer 2 (AI-2) kinase
MTASSAGYILAIDVGTGSGRAVLFDVDAREVASSAREWSHPEVPDIPGSQVFLTQENWDLICACIREVIAKTQCDAGRIMAVSATSMREGMVLYDREGTEIWACPNADARADREARSLIEQGWADRIYELSGDWVSITAPARLLWVKAKEPEIFSQTRHIGMLSDWITYRLCGEFVTEPTAGSSSGMFSLTTRTWSPEIADMVGLEESILPPVVGTGSTVGKLSTEAAKETSLAAGTPVIAGGADTQMGLHGLGVRIGELAILGGTFWQQATVTGEPLIDPQRRLRTLCHVKDDQWMLEGIGFYSGLALRWFRDAFCSDLCAEAQAGGLDPYQLIDQRAMTVPPGANGVIAVLANPMQASNWRHPSPSFVQFDLSRTETGRDACARAVLETAAYLSRAHLEMLTRTTGVDSSTLVMAGGACVGQLWPQIVADVTGRSVLVSPTKEASALGVAIRAGSEVGMQITVPACVREVTPDSARQELYADSYESWSDVTNALSKIADNGLLRPLWTAPGSRGGNDATVGGASCAR